MTLMLKTLVSLAISATLIKLAMAANYIVGGPNGGWDTSTSLQTWASSQSFSVGDNLIFQYAPNHDVVEVSKADYDSCQASNPIQSYNGGPTTIPLSSPGERFLICGTIGHCSQGMKVQIDTLASSSAPPESSLSPSAEPPASSPESTPPMLPPSPSDSPLDGPASSSVIPPIESTRTSSTGSSTEPPSSSAHKGSFVVSIVMGFSFAMMMIQA